ncbi:hypothetical protein ACLBOM_33095 [Escherichia coli]
MAYLFINGHYLQDKVIMPVLKMIKGRNKKSDINHIKTNYLGKHQRDKVNEIINHFDKKCNLDTIMAHEPEFYSTVLFLGGSKGKIGKIENVSELILLYQMSMRALTLLIIINSPNISKLSVGS